MSARPRTAASCPGILRNAAQGSEHRDVHFRIADVHEGDGAGVARRPPKALRALDRRCGARAFDRLARRKVVTCEVERHGNELRDLADGRASGTSWSAKAILPASALNWIKCCILCQASACGQIQRSV